MLRITGFIFSALILTNAAAAQQNCPVAADFGCYMVKAADIAVRERGNLGWSLAAFTTRDYKYGTSGLTIRADPRQTTLPSRGSNRKISCNGAILEVLFQAINLYQGDNPNWKPNDVVPVSAWNSLGLEHVRAHISMFEIREMPPFEGIIAATKAKNNRNGRRAGPVFEPGLKKAIDLYDVPSVAHAFAKFGLGDVVALRDLRPGDVVTFDRRVYKINYPAGQEKKSGGVMGAETTENEDNGSTHSAIFINWLDENQEPTNDYSRAKGFRYVSSQSNDDASGLNYKWAYFKGFCPQDPKNKVKLSGDWLPNGTRDANGHSIYCPDQRKQDTNSFPASFPRQIAGRKSDCCVIGADASVRRGEQGVIGGRIKSPANWTEYAAKQKIAAKEIQELAARAKQGAQQP